MVKCFCTFGVYSKQTDCTLNALLKPYLCAVLRKEKENKQDAMIKDLRKAQRAWMRKSKQ